MGAKINLSEVTEFEARGTVLKVYPVSLNQLKKLQPMFLKMENAEENTSVTAQLEDFIEIVYEILKADNPDVSKEQLGGILNIQGCQKIIQAAVGMVS